MLESTYSAVEVALAAVKTELEILDAGVDERWQSYAWQFITQERWLKTLITEATGGITQARR